MASTNESSAVERIDELYAWYETMRRTDPVHYEANGNFWYLFRYDDIQRALHDYATFSSADFGAIPLEQRGAIGASIIRTDPPRHRHLRSLVSKAFTPRAVTNLAPRIEAIASQLLDQVTTPGKIDVIGDLAYPLPVIVIAEMLGIPPDDREQFKRWSDAIVGNTMEDGFSPAQRELGTYFFQVIGERRRAPRNDLISALLAAEVDGQHLSLVELLGFCVLLLVAGNETTTNLIGNAMYCFARDPDLVRSLRDDPTRLPNAIEEVLRYLSPVQMLPDRVATADVEIGGQKIKAGQHVIPSLGSANRDESIFAEANRFIPDRLPNPHLAFGTGSHFCLGAPLARLEAKIALTALLGRCPEPWVIESELQLQHGAIVFGFKREPMTYRVS